MWNEQKPLKFLMSLPDKIGKESLKRLQSIIDEDRTAEIESRGKDVCGKYAPFCKFCDKSMRYPCAIAYVKMQQADGLCIEVSDSVYESLKATDDGDDDEAFLQDRPNRIRIAIAKKVR